MFDAEIDQLACCGTEVHELTFEQFMRQVRTLYPDFDGKLCPDGVFDNLMAAFAHAFYDLYVCDCGMAYTVRESIPHLSCCCFDRWVAEYGLLEDECFAPVCFLTADQRVLSLRAQLKARWLLEWGGLFNKALIDSVAEALGIEAEIILPHIRTTTSGACVATHGMGGLQVDRTLEFEGYATKTVNPGGSVTSCTTSMDGGRAFSLGTPGGRPITFRSLVTIVLKRAPPTLYATACDVIAKPLAYNPYAEAFKCLIASLKPEHIQVCFVDEFLDADPTSPPILQDPCPNASGHYVHSAIGGDGTQGNPYRLDPSGLTAEQITDLVNRLKLV